ncbi:hypothetical protein FSP39_015417 [Pinctada imbricata]|uniref:Uncharacterized protein n=1 Tax=Pinctada imbricata TaxID=66713 RepID=A0AA89BMH5_PINIB|nr:hypothetical protein FSP39_015417 [Pinctada imbricata]
MLRLSNTARQSSTVGEIVNVMSIDCGRFSGLVHWVHNIWIGPFDVMVSLAFLFYEVGASAFAGFSAILIFIPINGFITRWNRSNHIMLARKRDERQRSLNEILNGIKVLKLYAWEESFEKRILHYREEEMSLIKRIGYLNSLNTLVWHIGPFLVSLATFAVFTLREKDYDLNAEKVFVSMAIFDILGRSMLRLPQSFSVMTAGSTAYVSQQAWIQNATLQDNILFGKPFNFEMYSSVIENCALKGDLEILPKGDKTEIGEKGRNSESVWPELCTRMPNLYLLDDPLSAVDAHVGKHIFEKVIGPTGVLRDKTRVFVTHGITYLPKVDLIISLDGGRISEIGTYHDLASSKGPFSKLLQSLRVEDNHADEDKMKDALGRQFSIERQRAESLASTDDGEEEGVIDDVYVETKGIQEGKDETLKLYMSYFGRLTAVSTIFIVILSRLNDIFSNYWLSDWATDKSRETFADSSNHNKSYRLIVYAFSGLFQGLLGFSQALLLYYGGLHASRKLYQRMLRSVITSPMSFFETNAVGRIVSRFAKDVESMDWFAQRLKNLEDCMSTLVAVPLAISLSMPYFLVCLIPIVFIYRNIQNFHVPTTRQLKRLETSTRSPIYSHFGESINGAATIRAYGEKARFEAESRHKIDYFNKAISCKFYVYRWLGVRLEFMSSCLVLCAATFAVITRDVLSAGVAAVCITCTLNTTHELNRLMQVTLNADEELLSIQRITEYIRKPTEAAWRVSNDNIPNTWPREGHVTFNRYSVRYRKDLDLVLRKISCEIAPREKVGIVGRTGAGKSSLTMSLFRIIERETGSITIDNVDISDIGLHDLRMKLTIIPQDPVLFSGTLRMNLDPFDRYSDDALWEALDHAHLGDFVRTLPRKLYHECMEGGENLSVGQRQLVCLARALLRKTKILILDEATAAVDMETDKLIQKTIRTEFAACTILTIAHRLNTVMDYDKIMVLASGKIREFDTPKNLLKTRDTLFYSMARDAKCL